MSDPFKRPDASQEGLHNKLVIGDFKSALGYSAGKRVVALAGQQGDAFYTLYGASVENIARRDWATGGAPAGQEFPYVLQFTEGAAFIERVALLSSTLAIDERALLGVAPALPFPEHGWTTAVVGELRVGASSALVLRPREVSYRTDRDELVAIEPGDAGVDAAGKLVATMSLSDGDDVGGAFRAEDLRTAAAALFDRVSDSGWEQVSPVWLATTQGFLRFPDAAMGTVPYGLRTETRPMDVTGWFQDLPDSARVFLMLDRSGTKTLSVRFDGEQVRLQLEIDRPALDFVLSGTSCDTALLADPQEPPGPAAVHEGPALHLVSPPLAPEGRHAWELVRDAADAPLLLQTQRQGENKALHFVPHGGWVRPWEAAVNAPGALLSPLRVLIPTVQAGGAVRIRMERQGLAVLPGSFLDKPEPEVTARHGPIARFRIERGGQVQVRSDELGGNLASTPPPVADKLAAEPAVLRPEYRVTPVLDGAGHPVSAPFSATYALKVPPAHGFSAHPAARPRKPDETFCLRDPAQAPELRVEAAGAQPDHFGWWDRQRFFRRGSGQDQRLELLEAVKEGEQWRATPWLRLSDDSLVRQEAFALGAADPGALVDGAPAGGWKLASNELGSAGEGLSLFRLVEVSAPAGDPAAGPEFFLYMQGIDAPVAELKAPASESVVNRLVLASSPWEKFAALQVGAVKLSRLNCLFLELERIGGRFQVKRGMLGWTVSECFKLDAIGDLQFTEFYERNQAGLERTLEFNGGARSKSIGSATDLLYQLEVYFWSSVLQGSGSLRVMCKHVMHVKQNPARHVVAIQDARVFGDTLDLSCDIALFEATEASGEELVALDTWETSRRGLFTVTLDQRRDFDRPSAFLKIRMAGNALAAIPQPVNLDARLQPSWRESDDQILPWFSAELSDRRSQTSWLRERRLWTDVAPGGSALSATLYALEGKAALNAQAYRACTLGTRLGAPTDVIAQWIPSAMKDIVPSSGQQPEKTKFSRLWLFDPLPRTIAEWPNGTEEQDTLQARKLLAGLGWAREAVLEVMAPVAGNAGAAPRPKWVVIDSPLLNRDATIGWLAWPLHKKIVDRPGDALPLTSQVVHVPPVPVREASVRVLFADDKGNSDDYRYPQVYRPAFPEAAQPGSAGSEVADIGFWSPGLRAGTQHVAAIENGGNEDTKHKVFDGWSMPPTETGMPLASEPIGDGSGDLWLSWAEAAAPLDNIELVADSREVLLALPAGGTWTHVEFNAAPEGLMFRNRDGKWQPAVHGERFQLSDNAAKLALRLEAGVLWSEIRLTAIREAVAPTSDAIAAAAYFSGDGLAARLAGIFVDDELRRFGREPVWFRAPAAAGKSWTRVSATRIPASSGRICVATMDMLGRTVLYEEVSQAAIEPQ